MKKTIHKLLSWCPLYRMAVGGYCYYRHIEERRYQPSQFCSYGTGVKIGEEVVISHPERMRIGNGVLISSYCHIRATGGFEIGNYSGMGPHTVVLTTDHRIEGECVPFDDTSLLKPVIIGDCVWIGSHVAILGGVTIGEGAIIGLGSVVRRDVPPCAIAVGNPARVIGYRDKDQYYSLKNRGATRAPVASLGRFQLSTELRHKYRELLKQVGYDVDSSSEYVRLPAS